MTNSEFVFNDHSKATFWSGLNMDNSKMVFLDAAGFVATSQVDMVNNSSLTAGDGTTASVAYIKFDGGILNLYDSSFITIQSTSNYYHNWSNYNSKSNNKSYNTLNNKLNCGNAGKNSCTAQLVYGPASLNFAGLASHAILPVQLVAFNVKLSGNVVVLDWVTNTEVNASHFEIERSVNGKDWVRVGIVNAKGNSSHVNRYNYRDMLKQHSNAYYRLNIVDIDGSSVYSQIRSVKTDMVIGTTVYPNPANQYVIISLAPDAVKNVQLINVSGSIIKQVKGSGNINMNINDCKPGNYYVRAIDANGAAEIFKLVISK